MTTPRTYLNNLSSPFFQHLQHKPARIVDISFIKPCCKWSQEQTDVRKWWWKNWELIERAYTIMPTKTLSLKPLKHCCHHQHSQHLTYLYVKKQIIQSWKIYQQQLSLLNFIALSTVVLLSLLKTCWCLDKYLNDNPAIWVQLLKKPGACSVWVSHNGQVIGAGDVQTLCPTTFWFSKSTCQVCCEPQLHKCEEILI